MAKGTNSPIVASQNYSGSRTMPAKGPAGKSGQTAPTVATGGKKGGGNTYKTKSAPAIARSSGKNAGGALVKGC